MNQRCPVPVEPEMYVSGNVAISGVRWISYSSAGTSTQKVAKCSRRDLNPGQRNENPL